MALLMFVESVESVFPDGLIVAQIESYDGMPPGIPALDQSTARHGSMIPPQGVLGFVTVKFTPLLAWPPTLTITFPLPGVAPQGIATILVALQVSGTAGMPWNVTVLGPCVEPKFDPVIV